MKLRICGLLAIATFAVQTDMSSGDPVADWVARLSDH
jgi:hypothetical protein